VVAEQDPSRTDGIEAVLVGTPLVTGSETLGAIVARFSTDVTRDQLLIGGLRADVLRAFGIHAAAAFANAEAHSRTAEYSEALEDWVEHVSAVMHVTDAIAPSLNLDEALAALAKATAGVMNTDECVIFLPDREGNLAVRSSFCGDERRKDLRYVNLKPGQAISGRAYAEKTCVASYDAQASDDELTRKLCADSGLKGILSAPLIVGDEAIGVIALYCTEPREFSQKDIQLAMSIALHAAVVVRNAKLYSTEANIAERLQRSLVSEAPEHCGGLEFAGRYMPALDEAIVGGDFYDVTPLPNGKIAVAIADVSGKGLEAAMHLAACKYMLKALAYAYPDDPARVLSELNNAINHCFHYDFFVTAFYAVIDPQTREVTFANAGHPPAFLVTENANMHTCLASTGIPLGAGPSCDYQTQSIVAKPGDVLLLYTDGVTDAVKGGIRLELEGLHSMVFEAGLCPGAELVDRLVEQLSRDLDPSRRDDMALLAVSFGSAVAVSGLPLRSNPETPGLPLRSNPETPKTPKLEAI
jgi:serine phosphatase RsbU (regulator of sigma subunit)